LLGFWALEPLLMLGAVPDLAINLLSSKTDQTSIPFHWSSGIVPFVVAASIFGVARFKTQTVRLSMWILAGAASLAIYSPVYFVNLDVGLLGSPRTSIRAHALSLIPKGAPVSATEEFGGHLSQRRYIYTFPYAVRPASWIIVDFNDPTFEVKFKPYLRKYQAEKAWRTVFSSHRIFVLHKQTTTRP
jgi:uncharacterized membrane protein